jgi:subtilisin family serine protease
MMGVGMRSHIVLLLVLATALGCSHAAWADEGAQARWIVEFEEAPLARFAGDLHFKATDPNLTGAARLDLDQQDNLAYLKHLHGRQAVHLAVAESALGRTLAIRHRYRALLNGVSLDLTDAEAKALSQLPGVLSMTRVDKELRVPLTDAGPAWVGAEAIWEGLQGGAGTRGEGAVIGIIDSGINESHPAFAATDADGFVHSNPRDRLYGLCQQTPSRCNAKLIGIYEMTDEDPRRGEDLDGHGSHVAATAAGNVLDSSIEGNTVSLPLRLSGVAPRASIISYKACTAEPSSCPLDALFAALEQATLDGVDVINYSIGGLPRDPWAGVRAGGSNSDARLMLEARRLGVTVVAAAGNSGPGAGSVTAPGNAPWVLAVANASHDRSFINAVLGLTGGGGAPPGTLFGLGISAGIGERDIVYAGDFGFALCSQGDDIDFPPTGASNPWPPGTFDGQIVVCDRGVTARVAKGFNLKEAGAGGMILVNMEGDGESIVSDDHFLPATHLGFNDGAALKAWLANGSGHRGRLGGLTADRDPARADMLAASSSRGPALPFGGYLKPDLAAPGSSILAASHEGDALVTRSGTSMATPHVAGAAALLRARHPDWTPDMVESALLSTLRPALRLQDGVSAAQADARGGGALDVAAAAAAGLYLRITDSEFRQADPQSGGDPSALNRPSLHHPSCFETCSFSRRVTSLLSVPGQWVAEGVGLGAASISVQPSSFTLAPGASQTLVISVDVRDPALPGSWVEGRLRLRHTGSAADVADAELPLRVFADPGALPQQINLASVADQGVTEIDLDDLVALPEARFQVSPLARVVQRSRLLPKDEEVFSPFDGDPGTWTELIQIAPPSAAGGEVMLLAETASAAHRVDLYVGVDVDGDGLASRAEILCSDLRSGSSKRCEVAIPFAPGAGPKQAWILSQNVSNSAAAGDRVDLDYVQVPLVEGRGALAAFGPGGTSSRQPFRLRLAWDEPRMQSPQPWYGYLSIGSGADTVGQTGRVPLRFTRNAASTAARPLPPGGGLMRIGVPASGSYQGAFIDVPAGATRLVLESLNSGLIDLHAMRRAFPAEDSGPSIEPAPPVSEAVASDTSFGGQVRRIEISGGALQSGRWYLTAVNRGANFIEADLRATLEFAGAVPSTPDGAWHNPARDGHGFFLSRGSGQWVVLWYSYDHLDLPQWFIAQAPAPGAADIHWRAPLFRFAHDGSVAHGAEVGQIMLTRHADNRVLFTWQVDGFSGSEPMRWIDPGPCPTREGQAFQPGGLWFPPAAPGSGFNLLASPAVEIAVLYLYDASGMPRWLYASADGFGGGSLPLFQFRGFCRDCAVRATATSAAGQVAIDYAAVDAAGVSIDATFLAPLGGTWRIDQAVIPLSDPLQCP